MTGLKLEDKAWATSSWIQRNRNLPEAPTVLAEGDTASWVPIVSAAWEEISQGSVYLLQGHSRSQNEEANVCIETVMFFAQLLLFTNQCIGAFYIADVIIFLLLLFLLQVCHLTFDFVCTVLLCLNTVFF